ncbi:MAG: 23S rRNA (pseudouridine(1915)-N(3))-methyltransferase RlmH [Gammaproteobacteria bacterium]|nr:23S rRNA (pseudouridine(1915)-N(3))-methyltransferase RlmH [Gammaproteobacteria bacterium]
MTIDLITICKKADSWIDTAFKNYNKRLPKQWQLNLIEIPPLKYNKSTSSAKIKEQESTLIKNKIKNNSCIISLDEHGKQLTSMQLAKQIKIFTEQHHNICFIIGGAEGLDQAVLDGSKIILGLSNLTFPHQLVRVILAEQIYRSWTILQNHPYHRD